MSGDNRIPPKPPQSQGDYSSSSTEDNPKASISMKGSSLTSLTRKDVRKRMVRSHNTANDKPLASRKTEVLPPKANFLPTAPGATKKVIPLDLSGLEDNKAPDAQEESLDSGMGTSERSLSTDTLYDVEQLPENQPATETVTKPQSQAVGSENNNLSASKNNKNTSSSEALPPLIERSNLTAAEGQSPAKLLKRVKKLHQLVDDLDLFDRRLRLLVPEHEVPSSEEIIQEIKHIHQQVDDFLHRLLLNSTLPPIVSPIDKDKGKD